MYLNSDTNRRYFDSNKFWQIIQKNNGTFRKPVDKYRRVWKWFDPTKRQGWAYGLELPAFEWLKSNCNAVEFYEKKLGTIYRVSIEHYAERGLIDQLGKYDKQIFLRTDQFDEVIELELKQKKQKKAKQQESVVPAPQPAWQQESLFG
jgi:hypothetical protein